jgi:hypothetical protein
VYVALWARIGRWLNARFHADYKNRCLYASVRSNIGRAAGLGFQSKYPRRSFYEPPKEVSRCGGVNHSSDSYAIILRDYRVSSERRPDKYPDSKGAQTGLRRVGDNHPLG